ncbi:tRNA pseudouridine synthase B [Phyllobacterium sp. CL33Tsu]|nr:tRNA pseudouridine synthase B [Phyllobacterium sp. CL33Tsu]
MTMMAASPIPAMFPDTTVTTKMARQRKKKGRPVSGWLIFDKPKGMGSTEAVSKIKWLFKAEKAGHAGTLDPLASGMLPIALGEATKTVPYVMDGTKMYRFTVTWGAERTTDDLEGEVTLTSADRPDEAAIKAILPKYTGVIEQVPPKFSAIKIAGERAYDLARGGEEIEIPAREVEIDRLELIARPDDSTAIFEVECGKGTYVRSLARDMGRDLGCYGHIADLRRIEVAPFDEQDFVTLAELEAAHPPVPEGEEAGEQSYQAIAERFAVMDAFLIETGAALDCLPQVAVSDDQAHRIRMGNPVILRGRDAPVEADEACVTSRGKLLAIGFIEQGQFKPKRVFTA